MCHHHPGLKIFLKILCVCVCVCVCMGVLPACVSVYHVCVWYYVCDPQKRSEVGVGASGIVVMGSCEPSCGFWELSLGSLQEESGL